MRDRRYRVWDPETEKMELVGALDWEGDCEKIITCNTQTQKLYNGYYPEYDFKIMEYLNKFDSNKKELCEGDIVLRIYGMVKVLYKCVYDVGKCCYIFDPITEGNYSKDLIHEHKVFTIVGNIFQNPEMLKG
jgi:uncharacterized phage protein (TIGR01671 family)